MPPSSRRSVSQPLWRALQVVIAAILVGLVIVIGFTRTQVGRDAIRDRLEAAFNQQFAGTLSIGTLRGSMIDDLVAEEVQLRDPSGELIATVDSVHASPRWANLLTAELSVQTLTIVRPHLSLSRDSAGTWNLGRALRLRAPPTDSANVLNLSFAKIVVQQGRVTTARRGAQPEAVRNGWVFDYTDTQVTDLSLTASARRTTATRLVDVHQASFSLPELSLQASSLEAQLRQTSTDWSLSGLDVSLDTTRVRGRGSMSRSTEGEPRTFSLTLDRSRIDQDELRRLVPRLPFAKTVTLEGRLQGSRERLQADAITVTHNTSFATLGGTIQRASDGVSLDLRLAKSRLLQEDVRDVWPDLPSLPPSMTGPLSLRGALRGTTGQAGASRRSFDLEGTLTAQSPHGAVQGSLAVERTGTAPLTYSTSLDASRLNLAPLIRRPDLATRLNGHLDAQGTGVGTDTLQARIGVTLSASEIAGRPLASADGTVTIQGSRADGSLILQQEDGGRVTVDASAARQNQHLGYTADLTASDLNLAPLGAAFPSTDLNARVRVDGAGTRWRSLTGTAKMGVDRSVVYRADSTLVLPPHSTTIQLAEAGADRPRIEMFGSVATLTIDGTSLGPPLWTTAQTWSTAFRDALRQHRNKRAPSKPLSSLQDAPSPPPDLRAHLTDLASDGPVQTQAEITVHQPRIVNAWWPAFPRRAEDFDVDATLSLGADSMHATGRFSASHLRSGTRDLENLTATYELSGRLGEPLAQSVRATAQVSAQRVAIGGTTVHQPSVMLKYGGRRGTLRLRADSAGIIRSFRGAVDLHLTPTTNAFTVREVSLNIQGEEWTNPAPASILAYSNALIVTPLALQRPHPQTPSFQRVQVGGTLSAAPTDTLSIQADNVYLPPFSEVTNMPHLIGGNLSGQMTLRQGWEHPQFAGDLSVQRLSYDRRLLGNAELQAEYSAQSPDLVLEGSIGTEVSSVDSLLGPDLVPQGAQTVDPNQLSVSGRIRLPAWARSGPLTQQSELPAGETLDLSVQVDRADLFFFRYIFEERVSKVRGYITGPLHVGGRLRDPVFDADFRVEEGAVSLPLFGLRYEVEGSVGIDKRGIHPRNVRVRDEEGTATVNGSILFNDYRFFSFDLSAQLDGLTVIDVEESEDLPFYGYIRGSGPLSLSGPLPDATLRSNSAQTTPDSELFIPVSGRTVEEDTGFIVFADSTGRAPDLQTLTRRQNILADRPEGVPTFVEGLNLDLNVIAPDESTVHLVFDPIVGDVVTVVGSGRVQLQRQEGEFSVFGNFTATEGTYLFTAGEVFVRRFSINQGTITWDGDPTNAQLDLDAEYRTRASPSGLPGYENYRGRIPVTVQLHITGRVATPQVDLGLSLTRNDQNNLVGTESLDAILNQPARTTEYATSVLLTNTFLLTTESITQGGQTEEGSPNRLTTAGNQLAFNSVSQLVSSQLNRFLGQALPNVDVNFGVQGEDPENLDLIYGVALRLLNERLIIRGEGVYTGDGPDAQQAQGPQGEFVVEVRMSSRVSAKVFYRRTGDELTRNRALTSSRGAGLSYQTQFSNWKRLFGRIFGWLLPGSSEPTDDEDPSSEPVARQPRPTSDSTDAPSGQR